MMGSLGQFQTAFAQALFSPQTPADPRIRALTAQPAFAVYRNTVMKACIDALEANFPVVARLVGSDWFRAAAALYVAHDAPIDARLLHYGSGFADFLRDFEPAAALTYLPGAAQLDTFWRESHAAQDAPCADAAWIASHPPEYLATLVLQPHPAARWAWFDEQPIYSIWQSNREQTDMGDALPWQGEGALLTRPGDSVTWRAIPRAGCVFLEACAEGLPIAQAADLALDTDPDVNVATLFSLQLCAGAFTSPLGSAHRDGSTP